MRIASVIVLICAGLAVFAGCDKKPANNSEAMARVNAAIEMTNLGERDEALGSACRSAAKAGAVDAVQKALSNITNLNARDEAASDSAIALHDCGQRAAATEVAKTIINLNQRDKILKKLASS
ncbi:MAG TPA: hypothetical protein VFW23_10230 [Tepidisphaeraceae bacterium]|nr:hypothetical protein [Tepidisphaeraceae bacterium]